YADDVHYMGGCLLSDNLSWASTMFAYNSCPPDPAVVGGRCREMWLERLAGSGLWIDTWLRHQRRDEYWRRGSVSEDYDAVQCPVLAVSGWADGYSNAVFRLLERLNVPRKGLIGPWAHMYPHLGEPGPAIGFLQEVVRWWDHWLKDVDNGVMDDAALRVWMQESAPPQTMYDQRRGRWIGEPSWPSPNVRVNEYPFERGRIAGPYDDVDETALHIQSPLSVGQYGGKWCSYNAPPDLPYDQREDDGGSLMFDTDEFAEATEILGSAVVELELAATEPVAMGAARLADVAPDGRGTRPSYGRLNRPHPERHPEPAPHVPGPPRRRAGAPPRRRAAVPGGAPAAGGDLHLVLAARLAPAAAGAAHDPAPAEPAPAAPTDLRGRRRCGAAAVRGPGGQRAHSSH